MRIFIIPSWFPTIENNLQGVFFKEQAQALHKLNNQVVVVVPPLVYSLKRIRENSIDTRISITNEDNLSVYRSSTYNYLPKSRRGEYQSLKSKFFKMIDEAIRNHGMPDIIHAHSFIWGGILASEVSKKYNIRLVVTEHSTHYSRKLITDYQTKMIKKASANVDKIIAVGPGLCKDLKPYIGDREIIVIPNIVNVNEFRITMSSRKAEITKILTVALLTKKKRIDLLLSAFAKVKNDNISLYIGGDGEERENLINQARELGIDKKVIFLGRLSREEVKKHMGDCDLFVLPSQHETFGIVYIEALASGKPIIATKSGGPDDIVNQDNGILIDVDNENQLVDALRYVIKNYSFYSPERIRKDCVEKYSEEVVSKSIMKVYNDILDS